MDMTKNDKRRGRLALIASLVLVIVPAIALGEPRPNTTVSTSPRARGGVHLVSTSTPYRARGGPEDPPLSRPARSTVGPDASASAPNRPPPRVPARVTGVSGGGGPDWLAIAECESGGNWSTNSGNGYWGGLQFAPGTWFAYGGGPFDGVGPFPYSAGEQIAVAERVYAGQGAGAWPNCFQW